MDKGLYNHNFRQRSVNVWKRLVRLRHELDGVGYIRVYVSVCNICGDVYIAAIGDAHVWWSISGSVLQKEDDLYVRLCFSRNVCLYGSNFENGMFLLPAICYLLSNPGIDTERLHGCL